MSHTSTYELYRTKVNCISEHRNGHGSGPAIWDYISQKLRGERFDFMYNSNEFWPLYKDQRLDDDERAVLLSTYDNAFVEVGHLEEFASACRKLHKLILETTQWQWSHFEAIAEDAEELHKRHDPRCRGLAIGCTSVCDLWEQDEVKNIDAWGVYGHITELRQSAA